MINDTPLTTGVNTLNAHDIAFYCCGNIFSELKLLAQQQRPTDNPFKTKSIVFTNEKEEIQLLLYA